ncbi:MAG: DUF4291 domain-containing protein [Bacteroidota bacterium]
MQLHLLSYPTYQASIPTSGQHILAQQRADEILVYQAYNHRIADYAIQHQRFGGAHFSYGRMSWIKPNFLWMMFRCGWGVKANQERILGCWLKASFFEEILVEAAYSSYAPAVYETHEAWQTALGQREVRLQWDPDHDAHGNKMERRAIQLGMKGEFLKKYGQEEIQEIMDLTDVVREQKAKLDAGQLAEVMVPKEKVFLPQQEELSEKLGLNIL